jgi:DNA modification methylase
MNGIIVGDVLDLAVTLPPASVQAIVTSPPYWGQRDYGLPPTAWPEVTFVPFDSCPPVTIPVWRGCLGREETPLAYTAHLTHVFRLLRAALHPTGTAWLNLGDAYCTRSAQRHDGMRTAIRNFGDATVSLPSWSAYAAEGRTRYSSRLKAHGLKDKDLIGLPWRVAFALQQDGWFIRQDCVWAKKNSVPEPIKDRPSRAHEFVFLLARSTRYHCDIKAAGTAAEPLRARRSWWLVRTSRGATSHTATYPPDLIEPLILASTRPGDTVLDPFVGSGTTYDVCQRLGRECVGFDLDPASAREAS